MLPKSTDQVSAVLRFCNDNKVKIVPRGAGTSLSGGALPLGDGILLGLSRMNKVLEIDLENRCAVVEPGVTNLGITRAVEAQGFYYAPDPSSQIACTIGGNVAENSGVIHCLKYGLTTNNLMGVEFSNFLIANVLVGLGWNFAYVGGSTLLTTTYAPAERAKVQASHDFTVYTATAAAAANSIFFMCSPRSFQAPRAAHIHAGEV